MACRAVTVHLMRDIDLVPVMAAVALPSHLSRGALGGISCPQLWGSAANGDGLCRARSTMRSTAATVTAAAKAASAESGSRELLRQRLAP